MPAWVVEIFKEHYQAFFDDPIVFWQALIVGAALGYGFHKLFHMGKVDALEERVKLKTEQIEVKDNTIRSMSADRAKFEQAAPLPPPAVLDTSISATAELNRIAAVNARIRNATEHRLRNLLLSGKFTFVYNPDTGDSKYLTFLPNGDIGDGRNENEHLWRIADSRLEILNNKGVVYSRFVLLDDNTSLHNTNDPHTPSVLGQYMKCHRDPDNRLSRIPERTN
jgi:hypothetical protein